MKRLLLLGAICLATPAWSLTVNVQSVTAQQAILQYTAPYSSATCTVAVSSAPAYTPLVHDVDTTLFANSNLDNRAGSISNGTNRLFLVGARTVATGLDGNNYSRSLQAFSTYFFQVTCGALTAGGTIYTSNPQLGNNSAAVPIFQAGRYGNYGWPTINWNDQTQVYIDPLTGLANKRLTGPGWYGNLDDPVTFQLATDTAAVWTNLSNSTSATSTTLASYSGTGNQAIFLAFDPAQIELAGAQVQSWGDNFSLDNVLIRLYGISSTSSTIAGCLSNDSGQTCLSPVQTFGAFTGVLQSPATAYPTVCSNQDTSTNCFPNYGYFGGWGLQPSRFMIGSGTVNVSTHIVTVASGALFDVRWASGTKIYIAGMQNACTNSLCTINSVQSSVIATIDESTPTLNGAAYKDAMAGIRLWVVPGSGAQSISLSAGMAFDASNMNFHGEGYFALCSPNLLTVDHAADGVTAITPVQGELCTTKNGYSTAAFTIFLFIPSTGETRLITPVLIANYTDAAADQVSGITYMSGEIFDSTNPYVLYAAAETADGLSIFEGTYSSATAKFKAYAHSLYPNVTNGYQPGQDTTQSWFHGPDWTDTGFTWANIMKGSLNNTMDQQITANDPFYNTALFGTAQSVAFSAGRAVEQNYVAGAGESVTLLHTFNLPSGTLAQTGNTWTNPNARWCANHASFCGTGWCRPTCNSLGGAYEWQTTNGVALVGPWIFTPTAVDFSGTFSTHTAITGSSPNDSCGTIPPALTNYVPSNPVCMTFKSPQPCSQNPYVVAGATYSIEADLYLCESNTNYSEISQIQPGDAFVAYNSSSIGNLNNQEDDLIISTQSLGAGSYQFTAVRDYLRRTYGTVASPDNWFGVMLPLGASCAYWPGKQGCTPGVGEWWDTTANWSSMTWHQDSNAAIGHSDFGPGPTPGSVNYVLSTLARYNTPFTQQIAITNWTNFQNSFLTANNFSVTGFNGDTGQIDLQGYPSVHQIASPPSEKVWESDYHHINPSFGSGVEVPIAVGAVTYSLVAGTTNTYEFTSVNGGVDYKNIPPIVYAGPNLLQDVSSPATGNIISDASTSTWKFCVALNANECRTGSSAGQIYMTVPSVAQSVNSASSNYGTECVANWYDDNMPCAFMPLSTGAQGMQRDISRPDPLGIYWRSLGMGFSGPGRQFQFSAFTPDPTATWDTHEAMWPDGVRCDEFGVQLPPWPNPQDTTTNKTQYVSVPVTIGAYAAAPNVRVRFGYAENGPPSAFYCTARADACWATGTPFSFASESPSFTSCTSGCTINIPAIPGRTVYYEVDRKDANNNIYPGGLQMSQVP